MSETTNSYLNITKGDTINQEQKYKEELNKKKLEEVKNYTKISMGKVVKDSYIVTLSCVFGIIPGQSISGFGIPEETYVTEVNNERGLVRMNNPAENTSSHTIITVNSIHTNSEEYENDEFYLYKDLHQEYDFTDEDPIQNY